MSNIAVIGSSPVSLIYAHIFLTNGNRVTLFEKNKNYGGPWGFCKINNIYCPQSIHVIAPNKSLYDMLYKLNIKGEKWNKRPLTLDESLNYVGYFPDDNDHRYEDIFLDYASNNNIIEKLLVTCQDSNKFSNNNLSVESINISMTGVRINFLKKLSLDYDYVFITGGTSVKYIEYNGNKIQFEHNNYLNQSLIIEDSNKNIFGSSLFHINGFTVVRELQTFNNGLLKNIIVVKLSRYFEEDNIDAALESAGYFNIKKTKLRLLRWNKYENIRIKLESLKNMCLSVNANRILFPLNLDDIENYYNYLQDLPMLLKDSKHLEYLNNIG